MLTLARGAHLVGGLAAPDRGRRDDDDGRDPRPTPRAGLTDGETAERSQWIWWQIDKLTGDPGHPDGPAAAQSRDRQSRLLGLPGPRRRRGRRRSRSEHSATPTPRSSRTRSSSGSAARVPCPKGVRFQVSVPTPFAVVVAWASGDSQRRLWGPFKDALFAEVDAIQAAIPADDLAIQFDVAVEIGVLEGVFKPIPELSDFDRDRRRARRLRRTCAPAGAARPSPLLRRLQAPPLPGAVGPGPDRPPGECGRRRARRSTSSTCRSIASNGRDAAYFAPLRDLACQWRASSPSGSSTTRTTPPGSTSWSRRRQRRHGPSPSPRSAGWPVSASAASRSRWRTFSSSTLGWPHPCADPRRDASRFGPRYGRRGIEPGRSRRCSQRRTTGSQAAPPRIWSSTAPRTRAGIPAINPGMTKSSGEPPDPAGGPDPWPESGDSNDWRPMPMPAPGGDVGPAEPCPGGAADAPGPELAPAVETGV